MNRTLPAAMLALLACGLCGTASAAGKFGADRHAAAGFACETCHGKGNPAELDPPDMQKCVRCHRTAELVEKTKDVKPRNPHVSPHYQDQLDCTNCHRMHSASENFCAQCHNFSYKVP